MYPTTDEMVLQILQQGPKTLEEIVEESKTFSFSPRFIDIQRAVDKPNEVYRADLILSALQRLDANCSHGYFSLRVFDPAIESI